MNVFRIIPPRATAPRKGIEAMRCFAAAGVLIGVMAASVELPAPSNAAMERIFDAAASNARS